MFGRYCYNLGILIVAAREKALRVTVLPGRHFRHNGRRIEAGADILLPPKQAEQMVAAGHCRFSSDDFEGDDELDLESGGDPKSQGADVDPEKGEVGDEGSDEPKED